MRVTFPTKPYSRFPPFIHANTTYKDATYEKRNVNVVIFFTALVPSLVRAGIRGLLFLFSPKTVSLTHWVYNRHLLRFSEGNMIRFSHAPPKNPVSVGIMPGTKRVFYTIFFL